MRLQTRACRSIPANQPNIVLRIAVQGVLQKLIVTTYCMTCKRCNMQANYDSCKQWTDDCHVTVYKHTLQTSYNAHFINIISRHLTTASNASNHAGNQ